MTDGPVDSEQKRTLGEGRFLRLVERDGWEYVERHKASGVVIIVPVTDRNELVLLDQYRPAIQARVIEFPAGLVGDQAGDEEESLTTAARRELLEEAGYHAPTLTKLAVGPPSPGLSDEVVTYFLARAVTKTGPGGGVDEEDIRVNVVALAEVATWLEERHREGTLVDPKIYLGLYHLGITTRLEEK